MSVVTRDSPFADRRGDEIWIKGTSADRYPNMTRAWKDLARPPTRKFVYVIIMIHEEDGRDYYIGDRRVSKKNVDVPRGEPESYVEAAFQQHKRL